MELEKRFAEMEGRLLLRREWSGKGFVCNGRELEVVVGFVDSGGGNGGLIMVGFVVDVGAKML